MARRRASTRLWLLGLAALVVAVLAAMSRADAAKRRDPYEVLGVAKTASDREVRPRRVPPPHLAPGGVQLGSSQGGPGRGWTRGTAGGWWASRLSESERLE